MKVKSVKLYSYLPFLFFFVYVGYMHRQIELIADDTVYLGSLSHTTVWAWMQEFYQNWSGRVPLQLLDIFFLNLPLFCWKIWNTVLYTLIPIYCYRIGKLFLGKFDERKAFFLNLSICALCFFLPQRLLASAVLWITGSFNYLLPMTMFCITSYASLAMLFGKALNKVEWVLSWIAVVLTCYAEQTAAVFLCMTVVFPVCLVVVQYKRCDQMRSTDGAVYDKWPKKKQIFGYTFFGVIGVCNVAILFAAPGNQVRSQAELLRWYPQFDQLNGLDKIIMGLIHTLKVLFETESAYVILLLVLLGNLSMKKSKMQQLCFVFLCVITGVTKLAIEKMEDGVFWQIYNTRQIIGLGVCIFWILLLTWIVFDFVNTDLLRDFCALLVLAVFASGTVLGFSPTIFASGDRIFFVGACLFILLLSLLLAEILQTEKKMSVVTI